MSELNRILRIADVVVSEYGGPLSVPYNIAKAFGLSLSELGIEGADLREKLENAREYRRKQQERRKQAQREFEERFGTGE